MLIIIPSLISEFLYQNHDCAKKSKPFITRHASYIKGFRVRANILNLMFYSIFLFRRLCFAAIIVFLSNYPELQISLIFITTQAVFFGISNCKKVCVLYDLLETI